MTNLVKKAVLGTVLGATAVTAMAPVAQAQRYGYSHHRDYRGYRHHDDGTAIVAGIAGLAIGAALASGDRRYDYDRRYYRERGYYPTDGYYYRDYYRRHRGWDNCRVRYTYDRYLHQRVAIRYCR